MSLDADIIERVGCHWARRFRIDRRHLSRTGEDVILEGHHPASRVNILELDGARLHLLDRDLLRDFERYIADHRLARDRRSFDSFAECIGLRLNPADALLYLSRDGFRPVPAPSGASIRELTGADRAVFDALTSDAELGEDGDLVEIDDDVVLGAFVGDELAAVASGYFYTNGTSLADISVVTSPRYRRRGLGKALVSRLCERLLDRGKVPQYRVQSHLTGSSQIAARLGFVELGRWTPEYHP